MIINTTLVLAVSVQLALLAGQSQASDEEAAKQAASACTDPQARLWSTLPDSASDIAEAVLFVCGEKIDQIWPVAREAMVRELMRNGSSLQSVDNFMNNYKREVLDLYRKGIIAIIIEQRYLRAKNAAQ